jgi:AcrR family transcriptional regulator
MQLASVDEVSRAVGINKATIYRHVASKDELFLLVLCSYLEELDQLCRSVDDQLPAFVRAKEVTDRFLDFLERYPAYVSCGLDIKQYLYAEVADRVSPAIMLRVNQAVASNTSFHAQVLVDACAAANMTIDDPEHVTTMVAAMIMGAYQVIRAGVIARTGTSDYPEIVPIDQPKARAILRTMLTTAVTTMARPNP